MRSLLRVLLQYIQESLESPEEDVGASLGSDNPANPEKQVDPAQETGKDGDVPGMLVLGMGRVEFRMLRRAAGLTMAESARLLGVTERTILRWEHGVSRIDGFKAAMIRQELMPGRWAKMAEQDNLSADKGDDGPSDT